MKCTFVRSVQRLGSRTVVTLIAAWLVACAGDPPYNGRSADEWAALLASRNVADRVAAATAFLNASPHHRAHVLPLLHATADTDSAVAAMATAAVERLSDDTSPILVDALSDSSVAIRRAAAKGLGHFRHEDSKDIRALSAATKDADDSVRTLAVLSLGARSTAARDALPSIRALATRPGPQRAAALLALPNIDTESRSLISVYAPAMKDADPGVRVVAVSMIIGTADSHAAMFMVAEALRDPDLRVRLTAARVLVGEAHHDSTAYDALANARASHDPEIRRLADSVIARVIRPR